jgi:alpha-L-fucosidase
MLVDIASKGGNLLLNVGPTEEGLIPGPSVERLEAIGKWMELNGESIYGSDASPFFKLPWGRCTQRMTDQGTTLYLHVFKWPEDNLLRVPGIQTKVKDAFLLTDREHKLSTRMEGNDLFIELPDVMADPINTVVVLDTRGKLEVVSNMPSLVEGHIKLPAGFADIHNPGYGTHAILEGTGEEAVITSWTDPRTRLEWMFHTDEPGQYGVKALLKADQPGALAIEIGENMVHSDFGATGDGFSEIELGQIDISETGDLLLEVQPDRENWTSLELAHVLLVKQ